MKNKDKNKIDKISDAIAKFVGSWTFIITFIVFLVIWININIKYNKWNFDPYPFILLNLILSTIAAIQAPLIMMSQNRQEKKDRERSIKDYKINKESKLKIDNIHEILKKIEKKIDNLDEDRK